MTCQHDLARLIDQLHSTPSALQLPLLKRAALDLGGRWDLPSDVPGVYTPLMPSIEILGVFATAETTDELAQNWLRVAKNCLSKRKDQ